jgi:mono/diheme cytochrome c family protein/plastocyanin
VLALGLPGAALLARWSAGRAEAGQVFEMRAAIAESGGWSPADIAVNAGQTVHLRLTSDDVVHGFAVGQVNAGAVDVLPGQVTETTIQFERPGTYVFYCTRWCGPNHWRMRGTIEVGRAAPPEQASSMPLYQKLGLDIDALHPAEVVPVRPPSAEAGAALDWPWPPAYLTEDYFRSHSPAEAWRDLRSENAARDLSDLEVWHLVAFVWQSNNTNQSLAEGRALYAANCAACHGATGQGDGVMAEPVAAEGAEAGHGRVSPASFVDPTQMFGASPALLQGKILRGGMGTGMPYWGPIFTESQTWALVDYLWTFSMEVSR